MQNGGRSDGSQKRNSSVAAWAKEVRQAQGRRLPLLLADPRRVTEVVQELPNSSRRSAPRE